MANSFHVNAGEFFAGITELEKRMDKAAEYVVSAGGKLISSAAKKEFRARPLGDMKTSATTGRRYYVGPADPPHPTNRTHNLSNSIRLRSVRPLGEGRWESKTGTGLYYSGYVEYGTSKMQPFPYLQPAVDKVIPAITLIGLEAYAEAQRI